MNSQRSYSFSRQVLVNGIRDGIPIGLGYFAAVGAYGPFTIGMLLAECGAGAMFGISTLIFVAILAINVYYYDRKNAPDLC